MDEIFVFEMEVVFLYWLLGLDSLFMYIYIWFGDDFFKIIGCFYIGFGVVDVGIKIVY